MIFNITRLRPLAGALVALWLIVIGAPWPTTSQVVSAQSQSFFVSFSDADGAPVTDITADEVVVEMDGEHGETLSLEPIDWPVRVTVFVDNGLASPPALDHMREGVRLFIDALPLEVEVSIGTIGGRPQIRARHTTDQAELADAIGVISPDMDGAAMFIDALYEEAERLHKDEEGQYFPVIVMVSTNGPEDSSRVRNKPFGEMMERLFANKATVHTRIHTITSVSGVKQGGNQVQFGIDIGEATGGSYEGLSSPIGFRTLLPQLAEEIARKHRLVSNQYRVRFSPPEGVSEQPSIRVLTTRVGVNMRPTTDGNIP
jgi:hypothetical protein